MDSMVRPPLDQFGPFDTTSNEGSCVEVAKGLPGTSAEGWRAIRDSKDVDGPVLVFTPTEWTVFATAVVAGYHD